MWWRREVWSTQESTESPGTTLPSPACRRNSTIKAWMTSTSRKTWVTDSSVAQYSVPLCWQHRLTVTDLHCEDCFNVMLQQSLTSLQKWRDLNVISSLLKSFFRKLPDPLFTNGEILYQHWQATRKKLKRHWIFCQVPPFCSSYWGLSCFIHRKVCWFYWSQQNRRLSGEIKRAQEAGEWKKSNMSSI